MCYLTQECNEFLLDERPGHMTLCHMVNPTDEIKKALGCQQLDVYVPIKISYETAGGAR